MKSIRREREKLDPLKNTNWKKDYFELVRKSCLNCISKLLPHYDLEIMDKDGFYGLSYSKDVRTLNQKGKIVLELFIFGNRLIISLYIEGNYTDREPRMSDRFFVSFFSIEHDILLDAKNPDYYAFELSREIQNHENSIRKYLPKE